MVDAIGATVANGSATLDRAGLGQEDFLKLFLTQLSFQDPLEPVDNKEFMAQMAQFASLDQTRQTNEKIDGLLTLQATNQAVGLIGKTVEVAAEDGTTSVGQVTTIRFPNGTPSLTVKLSDDTFIDGVSLSRVTLVR